MKRWPQAILIGVAVVFFSLRAIGGRNAAHEAQMPPNRAIAGSSVTADMPTLAADFTEAPLDESEPLPDLKINAALVKDATGSRIFYRLNANERWPLASLTKLMTATIAIENLPATRERDDFIRRMMVVSDNSAADGLADMTGIEQWIGLMNAKAERLGMNDTGFSDASGLSYLNQSTAGDISKLVSYILQRHPEIFAYSRAKSAKIGGTVLANINEFVNRPDFLGGKTGFTDEANGNLVTLFSTAQGTVVAIVLGTPDKTERFIQTERLFAWLSRRFRL